MAAAQGASDSADQMLPASHPQQALGQREQPRGQQQGGRQRQSRQERERQQGSEVAAMRQQSLPEVPVKVNTCPVWR